MGGEMNAARTKPRGFTMVELLLAVAVGGLAALATMMVFSAQNRASSDHSRVVDSQQNARAAMDEIVRDLREAGANLDKFHKQAGLVDAAPYQVVFNGDTRTGYGGDPAMESSERVPLWDGTQYRPGGFNDENLEDLTRFNNGAETVRLTLDVTGDGIVTEADTLGATEVRRDFQLVRQVNGGSLETVAYGVRGPLPLADGSKPTPVFQYWGEFSGGGYRLWGDANSDGELSQGELANLTAVTRAEIKHVREITVTIQTLADMSRMGQHEVESASQRLTATVRPRNIGLNESNLSACGYPPMPPTNVRAIDTPEDGGRSITLTFDAAFDDVNGEGDVREYSIYRRRVGQSRFGAPIYSMKASKTSTYTFVNDQQRSVKPEDAPEDGVAYEYYVTSWDCEPQESNPSTIAGPAISLPNGPIPPTITAAFDTPCDEGDNITVTFSASPDDIASQSNFTGYRLYRGTSPGITAYKVRVLDVSATRAASYTVHDVSNTLIPMSSDSTYYYVVRGVRSSVESVDSNQWGPVQVSDGLAAPVLTAVEDMPGDFGQRLLIGWVPSPSEACPVPNNVGAYEVKRKGGYESWSHLHTVVPLATPSPAYAWTDSTVTPDTQYQYKIVARSPNGDTAESNIMAGRGTAENELQPPLALNAADEPCDPLGAVRISWAASPSDVAGDITHYRIMRGTQPGVYTYELPWVEATGQATYSILDDQDASGSNAPQLGVTYHYAGKGWNDYYNLLSVYSNSSSVLAESTPTAPDIAAVMDTPNDGGRSITLNILRSEHDGVCDNTVNSYKVFRGTSAGAINVQVGSITALQLPTYVFVDNLVFSLDPPMDGVPYFYAVRAYANELVSQSSNVGGPVTSIRDGSVNEVLFTDNFELDRGWTQGASMGTDDWRIATPLGRHGSTYGNPDPATAYSGVKCAGTKFGTSNGLYSRNSRMWLESPAIDCRNASNIKLVFQRWLNVERNSRDKADIEIRVGSGSWTRVWRNPSVDVTDSQWSQFELDVTAQAAGFNNVKVRFVIESNSSRDYTGWNIDDFSVVKF